MKDKSKNDGYVSIHRCLHKEPIWLAEPFSRAQAWIDLIMLANYKAGYIRIKGERVDLQRGECGWSKLKLSKRWKWSRGKTERFLNELKNDQWIELKTGHRTTVIKILEYNDFQTSQDKRQDNRRGNKQDNRQDTNNKDNKNNKPPLPPKGADVSKTLFSIKKELSADGIELAKQKSPQWDVYALMEEYDKWVNKDPDNRKPRSANIAFPYWCESFTKGVPPR